MTEVWIIGRKATIEGGVKVKERDALIEAVADELVAHGEFSSIPGQNHANASKAAAAILPIILTAIEPVAASPGVGDAIALVDDDFDEPGTEFLKHASPEPSPASEDAQARIETLERALHQIIRMKTVPNDGINTFTLAAVHHVAETALSPSTNTPEK